MPLPGSCAVGASLQSGNPGIEGKEGAADAEPAYDPAQRRLTLRAGATQAVAGSSWGTFTIACTIPIALAIGLYMYKLRKGRVVEASAIGAVALLAATVAGNWMARRQLCVRFPKSSRRLTDKPKF